MCMYLYIYIYSCVFATHQSSCLINIFADTRTDNLSPTTDNTNNNNEKIMFTAVLMFYYFCFLWCLRFINNNIFIKPQTDRRSVVFSHFLFIFAITKDQTMHVVAICCCCLQSEYWSKVCSKRCCRNQHEDIYLHT